MTGEIKYTSNARGMEELRTELVNDLNRRIAFIAQRIRNSRSARQSAGLALIIDELQNMLDVWTVVEFPHDTKRKRS